MSTTAEPDATTDPVVEKVKTIVLPAKCTPSAVCSRDQTRPILCHAYLKQRDDGLWLYATDSFVAIALKVEGDAEEGYIPRGALKAMENRKLVVQDGPNTWSRTTKRSGATHTQTWSVDLGPFPDLATLGMFDRDPHDPCPDPVCFDAGLLASVGAALGNNGLIIDCIGPLQPIKLAANHHPDERLGILMPIRANV